MSQKQLPFNHPLEDYLYYLADFFKAQPATHQIKTALTKLGELALTEDYNEDTLSPLWRHVQLSFYQNQPQQHLLWPQEETLRQEAIVLAGKEPKVIIDNLKPKQQNLF